MATKPTQAELNQQAAKLFRDTAKEVDGVHAASEDFYPGVLKAAGTNREEAAKVHAADTAAAVGPAIALVDMVKTRTASGDWKPIRGSATTDNGTVSVKAQQGAGINKPTVKVVVENRIGEDPDMKSVLETIGSLVKPKAAS